MMRLKVWIVIGCLVIGLIIAQLAFPMKASMHPSPETIPFNMEGFVDAQGLSNTNRQVAVNQTFELYLNETSSHFSVLDKRNGTIWRSNPVIPDPWQTNPEKNITNSAIEKQKATLEISYFNDAGSLATITNYKYSIYHPRSILNAEGLRTFKIKYLSDGFQILYEIEDLEIDYLYFPKYLPKDVFESMPDRQLLESIAYKGFNDEFQAYEITQYVDMSRLVKGELYKVFYENGDYTRERAIEENMQYGYTETFEKIYFEIGMEVRLYDFGIKAAILHDSIVEPDNVKLANISLLPMMGTAISEEGGLPTTGYVVIPDGSGAIMTFNNGKFYQSPYRKRLYGRDLSMLRYKMAESQEKISMPVYGMIKENGGYAAIITQGDGMASINADVSGRIDSYNRAFASFEFREFESITLGSGFNIYGLDLWTKARVKTDFEVSYHFITGTENSYVGVANVYRNHLINTQNLAIDTSTQNTIVTTEILGAYDRQSSLLGIPYAQQKSLTTFDQAQLMITELIDRDITHLNILYTGMINGGLKHDINDTFDVENVIGGKRGFDDFTTQMNALDIDVYPLVTLMTASEYRRMIDPYRYTASRISRDNAMMFNYHIPSRLPYSETQYEHSPNDYIINPVYYEAIYQKLNRRYPINNIAFSMMGSMIAGHYEKHQSLYVQDAIIYQDALLERVEQKTMLSNPLSFAYRHADYMTDIPVGTTLYAIVDYSIPLVQLVLSGLKDYSTHSINMSNQRSLQYNYLKAIETGSNLKYTLTYRDSKDLLLTEYNYYMSTHYINWLDTIEHQVKEMDLLGIHQGYLINHELLSNNVYQVTYSHGLSIIINYNLFPVVVGTLSIDALDYLAVGG